MTSETKFFIGVIFFTVLILIGAVVFFSQPEKLVAITTLINQDSWATGSATAKTTLVEFSDFECPACINFQPVIKTLLEKYQNELKFVYRQFPLEQHSQAKQAALAAEAAGLQGKFWEMHDALFALKGQLNDSDIYKAAESLKLDLDKFDKDMKLEVLNQKIQRDIASATELNINSTPTFYLNGKKLKIVNFQDLDTEIKKVLEK